MAAALSHMLSANGRVEERPNVGSSRDRERHDSNRSQQQQQSAATLRPQLSFTTSQSSAPSSPPLTAEGLLATHATSRDPARSALDAAVSERNTLSVQNTRLWMLMEKQRSGYGQLMRELERVRGERDVFRARLQSTGENTDMLLRAHRDKDRRDAKEATLRSSSSHSQLRGSDGSSTSSDPRVRMARKHSEDTASRSLHHSHSQDQTLRSYSSREKLGSQSSLNLPASNSRASANSTSQAATATIRGQSFPRDVTPDGRSTSSQTLSPTQHSFSQTSSHTSFSSSNTVTNADLADPVLGQWQSGYRPSLDTARPMGAVVLTRAPEETYPPRDSSPARTPYSSHTSPSTQQSSPDVPSSNSLSPHPNGGARNGLSRESRISLPEEAKRYYANLTDSPMPSPGIGSSEASSSAGHASPAKAQLSLVAEVAESLRSRSGTPSSSRARSRSTTAVGDEAAPFLDMGDGDSMYSGEQGRPSTSTAENGLAYDDPDLSRRDKDAIPDDFPLPPTTASPGYPAGEMLRVAQPPASDPMRPPASPFPIPDVTPQMKFRALPLLASDLPHTEINVATSTIRPNERGKEVLSFVITVHPGGGKEPWKVEKLYSDVLALDARVRASLGKNLLKKMVTLPEGRMWRDHAPAKVDQRKNALQDYLRSLVALPVKNKDEVIAFFTSDIVREAQKPVSQPGYKEGYLTKRGKNFGGWKTRYFVLQGPSLEYYESRGGAHLGSITITGAQIGRQQKAADRRDADEDNEYRHAFLIIEGRRGPSGSSSRHVLCADSDEERDSWVEELVRYVTGTYTEDQVAVVQSGPSPLSMGGSAQNAQAQPRSSTSTNAPSDAFGTPNSRQDAGRGDLPNGRSYGNAYESTPSPVKSMSIPSPLERASIDIPPISNSLPVSSPLINEDPEMPVASQRANSELGHYPDLRTPDQSRKKNNRRMSVNPLKQPIPERTPSPEKEPAMATTPKVDMHGKVKNISGPINGTPIPAGYKFGGKDEKPEATPSSNDRREKVKSRGFWGFGRQHADKPGVPTLAPRPVFGVPLEESLDVAQIASLPAIVFRCVQYLEAKQAEQEEGIYRLSGSSAVIKSLKDRFNAEGDVDLLGSDEYWDPHAIAGLLKTFLRELPASILTRDLHLRFLSVIDFVDPQERIKELSVLIASLPIANYSLLRALTAHLILIVQNAHVNKMTMRNVGIVFSPTLGIPAGVFSLMLGEFKRVFNVDGTLEESEPAEEEVVDRRNSRRYTDAAADQLLGLSGRALPVRNDDTPSDDGEEVSIIEDSTEGTAENDADYVGSSAGSSTANLGPGGVPPPPDSLQVPEQAGGMASQSASSRSRASHLAATRGLNISTTSDKAMRRNSHVVGLPSSPRPSPRTAGSGGLSPGVVVTSPLTPR